LLILITLPSFWTDLQQISHKGRLGQILKEWLLQGIGYTGSAIALLLIFGSLALFVMSGQHLPKLFKVLKRAIARVGR
jgi:hypothetical protein